MGQEHESHRNKAKRKAAYADYERAMAEKSRVAMEKYWKRSRNLSDFDEIGRPNFRGLSARYCCGSGVRPVDITDDRRLRLIPLCKLALEKYNAENKGAKFVFDDLVKSTRYLVRSIMYYITFQAKEEGDPFNSPATTFQAQVQEGKSPEVAKLAKACINRHLKRRPTMRAVAEF